MSSAERRHGAAPERTPEERARALRDSGLTSAPEPETQHLAKGDMS